MSEKEIQINITMEKIVLDFAKDPKDLVFFKIVGDGDFYIANRNHKNARGMIVFPKEICRDNLKTLDDWFLVAMAIPKERMNEYIEKELDEKRISIKE